MPERLPPHDIDAEEAVNGSLLIDGRAIYETTVFLQPKDFYSEQNRWIYGPAFHCISATKPSTRLPWRELEREVLEKCGGAAFAA